MASRPEESLTWPVKDIVYTAIVGTVMIGAAVEWLLWLAAFLYCLFQCFHKAEVFSTKALAVFIAALFTSLRCIFLPIMVVTLPLPPQITQYFPTTWVSVLQWFAFWSFAALLTVPWLFLVFQLVTHQLGRTSRIKQVLDESNAPKIVVVMPCYNEEPEVLLTAINSVVECDYPPSCIHVFLSFDGDLQNDLYRSTVMSLGIPPMDRYPKSLDVVYRSARVTVSRFKHGGKRHCQKATFKLIDRVYTEYLSRNDDLFILFIDSDCILDDVCLQNFMYDMVLSPGNKSDIIAMTGVITSTTKKHTLITILQDVEYIHGQLFERTVESGCGAVTCLPGALTMLKFSAFRQMSKPYFADKAEQCLDLFDYAKCHMGEDRWLTHLFMIGAKDRHQIQMCTSAFCKTEAVQTYTSLIKQRRRWFLGFITNECAMLTDWRIWKRYPILAIMRFMQNTIRTTALLFFIMAISLITTTQTISSLPVGFIGVSLGLNWLMMFYFGLKLKRYKIWLYPIMFVLNPFFNWYYMVYGICTAGRRTWGGPRADAATADDETSPQEAIEQAEHQGDDLNIIPESFRNTIEPGATPYGTVSMPLQPPDKLVGRFAAPEKDDAGYYQHGNDSLMTVGTSGGLSDIGMGSSSRSRNRSRRTSLDSHNSGQSSRGSIVVPSRAASLMSDADRRKYVLSQATQLAPPNLQTNHDHPQSIELSENISQNLRLANSLTSSRRNSFDTPSHSPSGTFADSMGATSHENMHSPSELYLTPPVMPVTGLRGREGSPLGRKSFVRNARDGDDASDTEESARNDSTSSP